MPGWGWLSRPTPPPTDPPTDHGLAAQRAAEERLEGCLAALEEEELDDPSSAPFCGCWTCLVREVLDAAYPHLRALWEEER